MSTHTTTSNFVESDLRKKESIILKELRELRTIDEQTRQRRKQLLIEWADCLESQIEAGFIQIKKIDIASTMANTIRTHGGGDGEISYMYDCLPPGLKNSQQVKAVNTPEGPRGKKYVCAESKAKVNEYFDRSKELEEFDPFHVTDDDAQEALIRAQKLVQKWEQVAEDRHLAVDITDPEIGQNWQDELPKQFAEKYSIDKPKPKEGFFYQALCDFRDIIDACAQKAKEYSGEKIDEATGKIIKPAISEEDDKRFAKSIYALCGLFAPYVDDKWRRDWFDWYKIIKDRLEYSLHGAMSKSKLPTLMASALRGVTREQIDAKVPIAYKFWGPLVEDLPGLYAIHEFYNKHQQPFLGDLTLRMREKMSFLS